MFSKPVQDRRVSPAMVSKGSIYATVQQDAVATSRVLNGNSTTPVDAGAHLTTTVDGRALQSASRHNAVPLNHRATPNSDDTSDPDATSNTSFDTSIGVSARVVVVSVVVAAAADAVVDVVVV